MKTTSVAVALLLGIAILVSHGQSEPRSKKLAADDGVILFTYQGHYKMTPSPTLYSDLIRLRVENVELMEGPAEKPVTKITYRPWYGKIDSRSKEFRDEHETQSVSFLLAGDQSANVKKGDILSTCFYPN